ncbi:hypothetical protein CNR34_00125 [Pseudomonas phage nickie]|uniref:Uncharacterized protein n=1 Tax=Pseudomonas phage nickie TaxID=2048977 RepID=A0A2H4P7B0_9CAUD|nr:hypothetical protein FDJ16_gp040 [Pseudomonas phage nickie]ATW58058.1 hypothetical protein CNR34_00125 [Pseudomonas phage nickie]
MSILTRKVTIKEDELGLFVLYKPRFPQKNMGDKFVIRLPAKRNMFDSDKIDPPFEAGQKVLVQEFNPNMGWFKVRRQGDGQYGLWDGPRWVTNGFTACWVEQ